jgi:hypothetical protein
MALKLPYMLATGIIPKILEKIQQARRPGRFTQDFLSTKLGHTGGSARPIIPLLKRMGFLASDGSPTQRYDQFRNVTTQGMAVAEGMKAAFSELFDRNEYVYNMPRNEISSLVVEVTGTAKSDRSAKAIVSTFLALNELADFEAEPAEEKEAQHPVPTPPTEARKKTMRTAAQNVDFKVSYTINLNLPETTNPDVFNAIFHSLKENLLKD